MSRLSLFTRPAIDISFPICLDTPMGHSKKAQIILSILKNSVDFLPSKPSVSHIAKASFDPFRILISTVISSRTKDRVTREASSRLFSCASTPEELASLPVDTVSRLIYPCGFYRVKASQIVELSKLIETQYDGAVPDNLEALTALPGVGRKTANLTLGLGFGIPAVCVDVHVHRISRRLGWTDSKHPLGTEQDIMKLFPKSCWIIINEVLVQFGQTICLPRVPRCPFCPVQDLCLSREEFL